ncbi:hypothetical protein [Psychrobacter sp.]|uniref:hypothetical protein n=1 Tax=Psychrobacter sp. TaxID=56811 RepID=UPI002653A6B8|nr:hypothetical protein [Psychrobacter sp.]
MKGNKRLLAKLAILLIVVIALLMWLLKSFHINLDPVPVLHPVPVTASKTDKQFLVYKHDHSDDTLYLLAEDSLQQPLDNVIERFEARNPEKKVIVDYIPSNTMPQLPTYRAEVSEQENTLSTTDMIIANGTLTTEQVMGFKTALDEHNDTAGDIADNNPTVQHNTTDNINLQTPRRTPKVFSYSYRNGQALNGVVLTYNTLSVTFRNFLLSSPGQDILKEYDFYGIDEHQNSMDD